ncbi:MAG TPA: GtrA family protein, partial [Candidatus Paceibacterota bacterium]|nr:GtrA family protein [Candidatus Paceibacterota bacterium]
LLIQPILSNNLSNFHLGIAARVGIFAFFTLFAPLALWLCAVIGKFVKGFYQFGQFAAVGTLNSFIDLGVFNLETFLYGSSLIGNVLFAVFKAISFLCGTTNSFVWNKYWTFSAHEKPKAGEVAAFYTVAIIGWVINVGIATLVKASGAPGSKVWVNLVAPLCGIAASFLWDFFGYKYFVFKKKAPAITI